MGLFSSQARVKLSCVEGFRDKVIDFGNTQSDAQTSIESNFANAIEEVEAKADEMHRLSQECDALYDQIQAKKHQIEQLVANIKNQLQNTPKEIEVRSKDKNGNEVVKKKPNPEYDRLQKELKAQSSRLCRIKDLSWEVYNKCSELKREAAYVASKLVEIQSLAQRAKDRLNETAQISNAAARCLDSTVTAIQEYTKVRW